MHVENKAYILNILIFSFIFRGELLILLMCPKKVKAMYSSILAVSCS